MKKKSFEGQNQTELDADTKAKEPIESTPVQEHETTDRDILDMREINNAEHKDETTPPEALDEVEESHSGRDNEVQVENKADSTVPDALVNKDIETKRLNEPVSRDAMGPAELNTHKSNKSRAKIAKEEKEDRSSFNCPLCKGEGLLDQKTLCSQCNGTGKV